MTAGKSCRYSQILAEKVLHRISKIRVTNAAEHVVFMLQDLNALESGPNLQCKYKRFCSFLLMVHTQHLCTRFSDSFLLVGMFEMSVYYYYYYSH